MYNGENTMLLIRDRSYYREFHEDFPTCRHGYPEGECGECNTLCCQECGQPLTEDDYEDRFHDPVYCRECREDDDE